MNEEQRPAEELALKYITDSFAGESKGTLDLFHRITDIQPGEIEKEESEFVRSLERLMGGSQEQ